MNPVKYEASSITPEAEMESRARNVRAALAMPDDDTQTPPPATSRPCITKVGRVWMHPKGLFFTDTWVATGWEFDGKPYGGQAHITFGMTDKLCGYTFAELACECVLFNPREGDRFEYELCVGHWVNLTTGPKEQPWAREKWGNFGPQGRGISLDPKWNWRKELHRFRNFVPVPPQPHQEPLKQGPLKIENINAINGKNIVQWKAEADVLRTKLFNADKHFDEAMSRGDIWKKECDRQRTEIESLRLKVTQEIDKLHAERDHYKSQVSPVCVVCGGRGCVACSTNREKQNG